MRAPSTLFFTLLPLLFSSYFASAESLEDYAKRTQGHFYQGYYEKGVKTGWFYVHRYIGKYQTKRMAISDGTRTIYEKVQGKWIVRTLAYRRYYALSGNGELQRAEFMYKNPEGKSTWIAVPQADGLHISYSGPGHPRNRIVGLPKESLRSVQQLEQWLADAKPGAEAKAPECRISDQEVNSEVTYRLLGWERSASAAKPEKIAVLTMATSRGPYKAWLHKDLVVLKLENSRHEIREESRSQARSGLPGNR